MNVVGSLVVKLSAHIAEFTDGLQKAGNSARTFAETTKSAFASSSIVVGSFGVADAVTRTGKALSDATPKIESASSRIRNALAPLSKILGIAGRGVAGRAGFGVMTGMTETLAGASRIGAIIGGGSLAIGLTTAGVVKLGNAIKVDRIEAEKLGITYEKFKESAGELAIPLANQQAAEDMATAWGVTWKYAKAVGQTLITVPFIPLTQMARSLRLPPGAAERIEASVQARLPAIPSADVGKMLDQWRFNLQQIGKTDLEVFVAQLQRGGAGVGAMASATRDWNDAMKEAAVRQQATIGFYESFVRVSDSVADAFDESVGKVEAQVQAWEDMQIAQAKALAETPIDRYLEKLAAIRIALKAGELTSEQFAAIEKRLQHEAAKELAGGIRGGAPQAMAFGSREFVNALAEGGADRLQRQAVDLARRQLRVAEQIRDKKNGLKVGDIP